MSRETTSRRKIGEEYQKRKWNYGILDKRVRKCTSNILHKYFYYKTTNYFVFVPCAQIFKLSTSLDVIKAVTIFSRTDCF